MDFNQMLLEHLSPQVLRCSASSIQFKPIPHNEKIDLQMFRRKVAQEWNIDDVIAWMIFVARKYGIPIEDMSMHRFAGCSGALLMLMNLQNFIDRDRIFGPLLYREFRQMVGDESTIPDDWMTSYKERANFTFFRPPVIFEMQGTSKQSLALPVLPRSSVIKAEARPRADEATPAIPQTDIKPPSCPDVRDNSRVCDIDTFSKRLFKTAVADVKARKMKKPVSSETKKCKRRAQNKTGNKLWEFIHEALKDPQTSPSIVKWENENEGVFRIVESEKLARLWGQKKNNMRMTYEKLSRAMRTYYENGILVPLPKTGEYPKKLVYKFGSSVVNGVSKNPAVSENSEVNNGAAQPLLTSTS